MSRRVDERRAWQALAAHRDVAAEGTPAELVPHRVFEGNRPSDTRLAERLTPHALAHDSSTHALIRRYRRLRDAGVD